MTFSDLQTVCEEACALFNERKPLTELPALEGTPMQYPKLLPLMRFKTRRYAAESFGNVFSMYTRAAGGLMQLATLVFTPNLGVDVPLLLIDVMAFGKKRAVFVEYYDLTESGALCPGLEATAAKYAALPDYPEKPAWYVGERAPYSLIKGGADDAALLDLLETSVRAYAETAVRAVRSTGSHAKLAAFVDAMIEKGNPASATLERALGAKGAQRFFREAIMPAVFTR